MDRRLIGALWPTGATTGMAVTVSAGMVLNVAAGTAAVPSQNNSGSTLCASDAVEQVTIAAAPVSPNNRIDVVTVHPRGNDLDGGANTDWIFDVVAGTAAASPVAPAVPAGQLAIAQVYVPGNAAAIVAGNITDVRPSGLAVPPFAPNTPRGIVASGVGPPTQTDYTTLTNIAGTTCSWTTQPGRRYLAFCSAQGSIAGGASTSVLVSMRSTVGGDRFDPITTGAVGSYPIGTNFAGGGMFEVTNNGGAHAETVTFAAQCTGASSVLRIVAGFARVQIVDMGGT